MPQLSRGVLSLDGPNHFHCTLATQLAAELRSVAMRGVQLIELGLRATCNALVVSLLLAGSLSVVAAMMLVVVDLGMPFGGLIRVSDAPMRAALLHMRS